MAEWEFLEKDWSIYDGEESDVGYVLEIDAEFPDHLHKKLSSLPLAPVREKIDETWLSPFARTLLNELKGADTHRSEKLVSTLKPRKRYAIHGRNMALYMSLGMVVTKVHRVLEFKTSRFLEKYITFCTNKRKEAKSDFRKRMFKAMTNSVFGKFIENSRDYFECKLVSTEKKMKKWATCPRYITFKQITPHLFAVFLKRKSVYMRQSWGVGFTILEVSKSMLYNDFYNRIRPALDDNLAVAMTDTDSLLLLYTGPKTKQEVYSALSHLIDFSNFRKDHVLYDASRMNLLGYWKDEQKGNDIVKWAGAASKSYAMKIAEEDSSATTAMQKGAKKTWDERKCKGVARGVRRTIPYQAWEDAVLNKAERSVRQFTIVSKNHSIKTQSCIKKAVGPFDDKR